MNGVVVRGGVAVAVAGVAVEVAVVAGFFFYYLCCLSELFLLVL